MCGGRCVVRAAGAAGERRAPKILALLVLRDLTLPGTKDCAAMKRRNS